MKACIRTDDDCKPAFEPFTVSITIESAEEAWALGKRLSDADGVHSTIGQATRTKSGDVLFGQRVTTRFAKDIGRYGPLGAIVAKLREVGRDPRC